MALWRLEIGTRAVAKSRAARPLVAEVRPRRADPGLRPVPTARDATHGSSVPQALGAARQRWTAFSVPLWPVNYPPGRETAGTSTQCPRVKGGRRSFASRSPRDGSKHPPAGGGGRGVAMDGPGSRRRSAVPPGCQPPGARRHGVGRTLVGVESGTRLLAGMLVRSTSGGALPPRPRAPLGGALLLALELQVELEAQALELARAHQRDADGVALDLLAAVAVEAEVDAQVGEALQQVLRARRARPCARSPGRPRARPARAP